MPTDDYGIPELGARDLQGKPHRLNALLRFLAKRIEQALGNAGPVRFGGGPFEFNGPVTVRGAFSVVSAQTEDVDVETITGLAVYADNAAALAAGLPAGALYMDPTGHLMIVYEV